MRASATSAVRFNELSNNETKSQLYAYNTTKRIDICAAGALRK